MRHFNYFENGGPFPSACLSCGANVKLFDLGRELQNGGMAQLCMRCVFELAEFVGYADKKPLLDQINSLKADIVSRETELAKVPSKVEDLINGIRANVTDFIFAVSYSDDNNQRENVSQPEPAADADNQQREATPRNNKASGKPARK